MKLYIFVSIIFFAGFIAGYIICILVNKILNKINKQSFYEKLLLDFKNSIDEFKMQNQETSIEIKNAIKDSVKLSKILSTNQNIKGKYGEECLENIIKVCFPNTNTDYYRQFITKNSDGNSIRPDYVINLPNQKSIIIDCKLNLEKYIEYTECQNQELVPIKKKELINDINSTINDLYNKKYQTSQDLNVLDFIFMYIPLEAMINLIYTDYDFVSVVKNAYEKNIIIVGNSGILTAIRLVKNMWASHIQNINIQNIINIAQNIYTIVAEHSQNLTNLKSQFDSIYLMFTKEYNKFCDNSKIFKLTEELRNYGIEPNSKRNGKKLEQVEINKEFLN